MALMMDNFDGQDHLQTSCIVDGIIRIQFIFLGGPQKRGPPAPSTSSEIFIEFYIFLVSSIGLGTSSACARIGSFLALYVVWLVCFVVKYRSIFGNIFYQNVK